MKDLGEHASIAIASEDPGLVFVTNDKNGLWLAARELLAKGERFLRFWSFLYRAQVAAALPASAVRAVAQEADLANHEPT